MDVVKTNAIHPATTVADLIKKIKESRTMNSLYGSADDFPDDLKKITVFYHSSATADPVSLTLTSIFPFYTMLDIKIAIYSALEKREEAAPLFQSLLYNPLELGSGEESSARSQFYSTDYYWSDPLTKGSASKCTTVDEKKIFLFNPFRHGKQDEKVTQDKKSRFVHQTGEIVNLDRVSQSRLTYEDAILSLLEEKRTPVFHLFLFKDVFAATRPTSERDWNGLIRPYFPFLLMNQTTLTEANKEILLLQETQFSRQKEFGLRIDYLIKSGKPLLPLTLSGVRFLQFRWDTEKQDEGLEALFYDTKVSGSRPYMRLLPSKGSSVTKLHMTEENVPDLPDPRLLVQWSRERNPTPECDYAYMKVVIKEKVGQSLPVYMTLRLFNDSSADAIIQPPRGVRVLSPVSDLENMEKYLEAGLEGTDLYTNTSAKLYNSTFIYGLRLDVSKSVFSKRVLEKKLKVFSSFFQQISPLPGEQPLVMLRYKRVSNFTREDRVFSFLTQYVTRISLLKEPASQERRTLVDRVMEEFQIDRDEATKRVTDWYSRNEVSLAVPETKDFILTNNPGIDIAIFGQHPFYTFHVYRVTSLISLRRIITLLSLMFSAEEEELDVSDRAVAVFQRAEEKLEKAKVEEVQVEESKEESKEEEDEDEGELAAAAPDYLGDLMFMQDDLGEEEAEAASLSVRQEIQQDAVAPKDELEEAELPEEQAEPSTAEGGIADFFLTRLKQADKRLFDYTKTHPSLKKYVSMCAANVTRQPAVLTQEQYKNLRDNIYKEDIDKGEIEFVEYPLEAKDSKKEKKSGLKTSEKFYFLEYGTNPKNFHWYVCSKYFCTRDNLILRSDEFEGAGQYRREIEGRARGSKPAKTCPFCDGRLILNRRSPGMNETVIERTVAPKTKNAIHSFIGFLKKTPHPEGFYLPCCFLKPANPVITRTDDYFKKPYSVGLPAAPAAKEEDDDDDDSEDEEEDMPEDLLSKELGDIYMIAMAGTSRTYIVGDEKLPLEPPILLSMASLTQQKKKRSQEPQIGLLPIVLDKYFSQYPQGFVKTKVPQRLKPDGFGFLRIGVENRIRFRPNSFLAAAAPFFGKNTSHALLDDILEKLTPSIFLQMNYGNMVHEFYDPSYPVLADSEMRNWISVNSVPLDVNDTNTEAVARLYISYNNFRAKMKDEKVVKEYRQFALLMAEPNLLRGNRHGLTFIVLDILLDPITKEEKIDVRCPLYGFNQSIHGGNDIAFLMHHYTGIWEPIFYIDARPGKEPFFDVFQRAKEALWPPIVKDRVSEFFSKCKTMDGRLSYPSKPIDVLKLPPISQIMSLFPQSMKTGSPYGVVRDSYNHVAAVIYNPIILYKNSKLYIPIPCADDGYMNKNWRHVFLDWTSFEPPDVEYLIDFYMKYVVPVLSVRSNFMPRRIIDAVQRRDAQVCAVQLANGLLLPASDPDRIEKIRIGAVEPVEGHVKIYINPREGADTGNGSEASPLQTVAAGLLFARKLYERASSVEMIVDGKRIQYAQEKEETLDWTRDKKIVFAKEKEEVLPLTLYTTQKELSEIYEHLRIMFAKWLAGLQRGDDLRRRLESVIDDDEIPLYEKRKRLELIFGNKIMGWMSAAPREEEEEDHLLRRVNCSAQGAEKCSGRCAWRQEDEKCLLHVPEFKDIEVDVRELLYHRLIEELLRFGEKRRQLFENDLSYMIDLDRPIRDGNEYIIPEKSAAWYELMRMDWTAKKDEEPIFLEEKSSPLPTRAVPIVEETALPDGIEFLFPKAESGKLRIKRSSLLSLLGLLSLGRIEIQPPLAADAKKLTAEQIGFLVRQSHLTVGQVDLRSQEPDLILKKPRTMDRGTSVFFLIIGAEGPAVLTVDPESVTLPDRADLSAAFAEKLAGAEVEQEPAPGPGPGPLQQAFEQQKKLKPRIKGAL